MSKMYIYRKRGGLHRYKRHVINFPLDVDGFLNKLLSNVNEMPILIIRRHGADSTHKDFKVRKNRVLTTLQCLNPSQPTDKASILIFH